MSLRPVVPVLCLGLLAIVAATSPRWLPFNMDEFVHYQPLGCLTAPASEELGAFRESCHLYDLRPAFVGRPLPLRSYLYIGSFPAFVFAPFRLLVDDPVAARLQGAALLVAAALLAARYLRLPYGYVALAGLLFPFFALSFLA